MIIKAKNDKDHLSSFLCHNKYNTQTLSNNRDKTSRIISILSLIMKAITMPIPIITSAKITHGELLNHPLKKLISTY